MTITTVLVPPNPLTDSQTAYNTKSLAFTQDLVDWTTETNATASDVNADAAAAALSETNAAASELAAATSETNAAASAVAAASVANAAAWVYNGTYALNSAAISQEDFRTYRKITANSVTVIDPALDPTNWVSPGGISNITVTGTTHTAARGTRCILTNVAATTVTAPSASEGVEFVVVPGNGLLTNAIDFGAENLIGPLGTLSGTVTLDDGLPKGFVFNATLDAWVPA